ncbi:hypothetical protein RISK_001420 [Rhodopirellula islandica]|uniref:Serine protease n=1 Tax=Rhodopirellula islandica TaxID=595434 RepID=A0A0J1BJD7_RHOIS|nr:serine protease [Rhodopirellula islandica]KLU06665.1 hypothetical protein RISK_001420 [Rhodopirellula islandica]
MKKLLTLLCLLAVCGEFGYLLLKDHPHWPEIVWTPALWTSPETGVAADSAESVAAGQSVPGNPAGPSPALDSGLANPGVRSFTPSAGVPSSREDVGLPARMEEESGRPKPVRSELAAGAEEPQTEPEDSVSETPTLADQLFEPTVSSVSAASVKPVNEPVSLDRAFASLVRVIQTGSESEAAGGRRGSGNGQTGVGVIVEVDSEGFRVLTAAHVVAQLVDLDVELLAFLDEPTGLVSGGTDAEPRRFRSVEVIGQDPGRDLALLQVHWPVAEPGRIAQAVFHAEVGRDWTDAEVWLANLNGSGGVERISASVIDQKRARREIEGAPVEYLVLDQVSVPGMSGGGLFAESGELIGIISGNGGGRLHCIAGREIQVFLSVVRSD